MNKAACWLGCVESLKLLMRLFFWAERMAGPLLVHVLWLCFELVSELAYKRAPGHFLIFPICTFSRRTPLLCSHSNLQRSSQHSSLPQSLAFMARRELSPNGAWSTLISVFALAQKVRVWSSGEGMSSHSYASLVGESLITKMHLNPTSEPVVTGALISCCYVKRTRVKCSVWRLPEVELFALLTLLCRRLCSSLASPQVNSPTMLPTPPPPPPLPPSSAAPAVSSSQPPPPPLSNGFHYTFV